MTTAEDARASARAGADAAGLNFFAGSPRCVSPEAASRIARSIPPFVEPVGVFVNEASAAIRDISRQVGLRTLQLHGDEPASLLAELGEFRLIRAHRLGPEGLDPLARYLDECAEHGRTPDAVLVDARVEGQYGGTGQKAPWDTLADGYRRDDWPPLILAGGLTPENVAEAIAQVRPWAVDVAGGVEDSPGCKSPVKVARFIIEARRAFQVVGGSPDPPSKTT